MRRMRKGLSFSLSLLGLIAGCMPFSQDLRPPKQPEKLVVPPETEARFSKPPEYDDKYLNQDVARRSQPQGLQGGPPGSGPLGGGMGGGGMGGGMGGMGGGMGGMGPMGR